jgi:hypothetical protein
LLISPNAAERAGESTGSAATTAWASAVACCRYKRQLRRLLRCLQLCHLLLRTTGEHDERQRDQNDSFHCILKS